MSPALRRPVLGRHGKPVVAFFCGWELLALTPGSPVPTLSETVKRFPVLGIAIMSLLAHHWFVEAAELVEQIVDEVAIP